MEKIEVGLIPGALNDHSTLIPTQIDDYFVCLETMLAMAPNVATAVLDTAFTPVTNGYRCSYGYQC
jgi:hypothetical protein